MIDRHSERGYSLIEGLVSLTVLLMLMTSVSALMLQSTRINKSRQMAIQAQATARNCLALISQTLRSAGWDPRDRGFASVNLDPDLSDDVSQIEVLADIDGDGTLDDDMEQVLIRHRGNQIEWTRTSGGTFEILGADVSNDADGDGTPEPMFVPDSTTDPTRIVVTITTQSPVPDPRSGEFIRYTVSSEIVLRKDL